MERRIYLDNSATTHTDAEVLQKMLPYFSDVYGNGSSQHFFGREALAAIDEAREKVAKAIGAKPSEIYFTSGGTESDNWAIKGAAHALRAKGNHIITTAIEHPAVIQTCKRLEKEGFEVTYLPVDDEGFVTADQVENAITDKTVLISVMTANNEVGTIEPIREIGAVAKKHKVLFHTDAVQAIGNVPIDVVKDNIDMLSMSAHKFYGPKGVGVLYKRTGVKTERFMDGGEQERNMRASTLNTPGIVGLGAAIEKAVLDMEKNNAHVKELRDFFVAEVLANISDVRYNGTKDTSRRLASNANFSFEYIEGESILMSLDLAGIAVSSGSACSSGSLEPSYVLLSLGVPIELAHGSIRFSFGKDNTREEVEYTLKKLYEVVARLREMSPLFKKFEGEKKYV